MDRTEVSSQVFKVTVYSERAQVFRQAKAVLTKGEHSLIFDNLPSAVDRNTLQVSCGAGAEHTTLRSVQFITIQTVQDMSQARQDALDEKKAIEEQVTTLEDDVANIKDSIEAHKMVMTKATAPTQSHADTLYDPSKWNGLMDFVCGGIEEEKKKLRMKNKTLEVLRASRDALQRKINSYGGGVSTMSKDVAEVQVVIAQDTTLELVLSYVVNKASWSPVYDLRVVSADKDMNVTYSGMVKQSTSEDWSDARLELSTAAPQHGGDPPELAPWRISLSPPYDATQHMLQQLEVAPMTNMMQQMMCVDEEEDMRPRARSAARDFAPMAAVQANVSSQATSASFAIAGKHTVKSDNQPVKVTVMQETFAGYFRYSAVPKLNPHVYLKVKTINTTDYPFLPGPANVFADNQFVSTTKMALVAPGEEFWTFLGVDDAVTVSQKLIHKKQSESGGMLSAKRHKVKYSYAFKIKNTKRTTEEVVIWDQLPISEDKKITVDMVTPSKDDKGVVFKVNDVQFVEWFFNVKPGEEVKFDFAFNVDYPADERISGL